MPEAFEDEELSPTPKTAANVPAKKEIRTRVRPEKTPSRIIGKPTFQQVLDCLHDVRESGTGHVARCPAHADQTPSLSVTKGDDGKILLYCHAGCTIEEITEALGLEQSDLFLHRCPAKKKVGSVFNPPKKEKRPAAEPQAQDAANIAATSVNNDSDDEAEEETSNTAGDGWAMEEVDDDWGELTSQFAKDLGPKRLRELSKSLGVSEASLKAIGAGWDREQRVFTFPERSADGSICGIGTRWPDGHKETMLGSKRGLTFSNDWREIDGEIFIVEGPSDVAAGLDIGLCVIGRPSACGGVDLLAELLATVPDRDIIVMGEWDPKPDGRWPGKDGAIRVARELAEQLNREVGWGLPPKGSKDLRAWLNHQDKEKTNDRG